MTETIAGQSRRILLALAWALVLITAQAHSAAAHAALESSDPAANAVIPTAPNQIVMSFTEPLESADSSARLQDAAGQSVPGAESQVDPADRYRLLLSVPADIAAGTYVVRWQNVSAADGHPMAGFFAFTIGAAANETAVTATTGPIGGPPYWLVTLVKWLTYLGLAVTVAAWPVWLLTIAPAVVANPAPRRLNRDMRVTAVAGVVLLFVGSVLALVVQAWLARPRDGWLSRTGSVLTDSRYGTLWSWRMGAVLLLLALSIIALACRSRVAAWLAAVSAFLIPLPFTLTAHANAQTAGRTGAITADWLHLSAAMLWSGGLVFLAVLVWSARPAPLALLQVAVPRFSTLAVAAWVILGLTGAYSAWLLAGSRDAMTDTPYGKTLLVKLGLLLPVVILAAMHLALFNERTRERPFRSLVKWFRWSLALELVLVIAVLLTVGRLVGLQPAGEALTAARPTGLTETLDLAGHPATLSISPGAPGPNSYTLAVPDAPSDPKVEGLLRLTPPGATQAQKEIKLTRQPDGTFAGSGSELALDGAWQIETIVRQIGSFQWQQTATVAIGPTAAPAQFRSGAWRFDGLGAAGMIILAAAIIALTTTPGRPANQN